MEFSVRILTILFPPSTKGLFYHSVLVLFMSMIVGRQVQSLANLLVELVVDWSHRP